MTAPLILSLAGLGLLDSFNPSLFIAQFFLLTTPKPTARVLAYIAGGVLAYFIGGLLILSGLSVVISNFIRDIPPNIGYALVIAIGIALLIFGVRLKTLDAGEVKTPRSLAPIHCFFLGVVLIGNEVTTALPYFVALEQLASAGLDWGTNVLALIVYNGVFAVPMLLFLAAFLVYRERVVPHLEKIGAVMLRWAFRLIKWGSIMGGVLLIVHAGAYFVRGAALF